jgi:hypothetical protein
MKSERGSKTEFFYKVVLREPERFLLDHKNFSNQRDLLMSSCLRFVFGLESLTFALKRYQKAKKLIMNSQHSCSQ